MRVMTLGQLRGLGDNTATLPDGTVISIGTGEPVAAPASDPGVCDPPARRRAWIEGAVVGAVTTLALGGLGVAIMGRR